MLEYATRGQFREIGGEFSISRGPREILAHTLAPLRFSPRTANVAEDILCMASSGVLDFSVFLPAVDELYDAQEKQEVEYEALLYLSMDPNFIDVVDGALRQTNATAMKMLAAKLKKVLAMVVGRTPRRTLLVEMLDADHAHSPGQETKDGEAAAKAAAQEMYTGPCTYHQRGGVCH